MAPAISNVHEFPRFSASIFVLYEQIIIYEVFNDKPLLSLGWSASLSQTACQALCTALPVQHNWEGQLWSAEKRQWDQKGKGGSGRWVKGILMSSDSSWSQNHRISWTGRAHKDHRVQLQAWHRTIPKRYMVVPDSTVQTLEQWFQRMGVSKWDILCCCSDVLRNFNLKMC